MNWLTKLAELPPSDESGLEQSLAELPNGELLELAFELGVSDRPGEVDEFQEKLANLGTEGGAAVSAVGEASKSLGSRAVSALNSPFARGLGALGTGSAILGATKKNLAGFAKAATITPPSILQQGARALYKNPVMGPAALGVAGGLALAPKDQNGESNYVEGGLIGGAVGYGASQLAGGEEGIRSRISGMSPDSPTRQYAMMSDEEVAGRNQYLKAQREQAAQTAKHHEIMANTAATQTPAGFGQVTADNPLPDHMLSEGQRAQRDALRAAQAQPATSGIHAPEVADPSLVRSAPPPSSSGLTAPPAALRREVNLPAAQAATTAASAPVVAQAPAQAAPTAAAPTAAKQTGPVTAALQKRHLQQQAARPAPGAPSPAGPTSAPTNFARMMGERQNNQAVGTGPVKPAPQASPPAAAPASAPAPTPSPTAAVVKAPGDLHGADWSSVVKKPSTQGFFARGGQAIKSTVSRAGQAIGPTVRRAGHALLPATISAIKIAEYYSASPLKKLAMEMAFEKMGLEIPGGGLTQYRGASQVFQQLPTARGYAQEPQIPMALHNRMMQSPAHLQSVDPRVVRAPMLNGASIPPPPPPEAMRTRSAPIPERAPVSAAARTSPMQVPAVASAPKPTPRPVAPMQQLPARTMTPMQQAATLRPMRAAAAGRAAKLPIGALAKLASSRSWLQLMAKQGYVVR